MSDNYIALSFDIESWYHGAIGLKMMRYDNINDFLKNDMNAKYDLITDETLRIIKILDDLDIRATFFLVADVAIRYRKISNALKNSNHEIGSHSLTHMAAVDQNRRILDKPNDQWYLEQQRAKIILEDIFERKVLGFRAPSAYFANWMIPMLVDLGFKYDSSIAYNSFYNKSNVNLRNIPNKPYRLNSKTMGCGEPDSELIELPWSNMKVTNRLILPGGGAFFFRLFGYSYFKYLIKRALIDGDTMFYLHPLDISNKPIPAYNSKIRPFYWIKKGESAEKQLIKLLYTYAESFTTCYDVYLKYLREK